MANDILTRNTKLDFEDYFVYGAKTGGEEGKILAQDLPSALPSATDANALIYDDITSKFIATGLRNSQQADTEIVIPASGLIQTTPDYNLLGFTGSGTINALSIIKDTKYAVDDFRTITVDDLEGVITGGTMFSLLVKAGTTIKHNFTVTDNLPTTASEYRPIFTESKEDVTFVNDTIALLQYNKKLKVWHLLRSVTSTAVPLFEIPITFDISDYTTGRSGIKLTFASGNHTMIWGDGTAPEPFVSGVELTHTFASNDVFNGVITTDEPVAITSLIADNSRISKIENFGVLTSLAYVDFNSNSLTEFDFADVTNANVIYLAYNSIITISNLNSISAEIESLDLFENSITGEFILKNRTSLYSLRLYNNDFSLIDVSGCSSLPADPYMTLGNHNLETLYVTDCSSMSVISASYQSLINLDITGCVSMTQLRVKGNKLTKIEGLTSNIPLTYVDISYNKFTSLDFSNIPLATEIRAHENLLTEILNDSYINANITHLNLYSNQIAGSFNLTNKASLGYLRLDGNLFTDINISGCSAYQGHVYFILHCVNLTILNVTNCTSLVQIGGVNKNISEVTGLATCTALNYIDLSNNNATGLEVDEFVNDTYTAMQITPTYNGTLNVGGTNALRTAASDVAADAMIAAPYNWTLTE